MRLALGGLLDVVVTALGVAVKSPHSGGGWQKLFSLRLFGGDGLGECRGIYIVGAAFYNEGCVGEVMEIGN